MRSGAPRGRNRLTHALFANVWRRLADDGSRGENLTKSGSCGGFGESRQAILAATDLHPRTETWAGARKLQELNLPHGPADRDLVLDSAGCGTFPWRNCPVLDTRSNAGAHTRTAPIGAVPAGPLGARAAPDEGPRRT